MHIRIVNRLIYISLLMYCIRSPLLFIIIISTSSLPPMAPGHHSGRQDPSHQDSGSCSLHQRGSHVSSLCPHWTGHVVCMNGFHLHQTILYSEAPRRDGKTIWEDPWRLAPSNLQILATTGGELSLSLWTGAYPPVWGEEGSLTPPVPESSNPHQTLPMRSLSMHLPHSRLRLTSH